MFFGAVIESLWLNAMAIFVWSAMSGRITAIEPQARHANRFNLHIDDKFVMGLSSIIAAKLRVGQTLSDADLAALERAEAYETAHEQALRYLEPRPRSSAELKQQLRKKKAADAVIDQVIARLTEAGLLDDEAFAKYWVENRETFRPRAGRALRFEMKRKGLSSATIAEAIGTLDESDSAYRAGLARAKRWSDLDRQTFLEKLTAFLVRRGFGYAVAKTAAVRLWDERDAETSEE
jgi:regulatory protein